MRKNFFSLLTIAAVLMIVFSLARAATRKLATYQQQAASANSATAELLRVNVELARQLAESERRNQEAQNQQMLYQNAQRDSETVNAIARWYTITRPTQRTSMTLGGVLLLFVGVVWFVRARRNQPLF